MKRTFALVMLALPWLAAHGALAADVTEYTILVNGGKTRAGHQTVKRGDDGATTQVEFVFKDNGRGPELKEEFTLGKDGTYATYRVKGQSTFGGLVEESFDRNGDKARWQSRSDKGEQDVFGGALYSPLGGTPEGLSVAIGALAKRSDGKLPLIPSGTLTMRKLVDAEIEKDGVKRKVQLLALTGIGFTPNLVWATADASPRLFASIYPGFFQLVEDGWEKNVPELEKQQKVAEKNLIDAMQQRLAHPLAGSTLIRNARVFDSERAVLGPPSDVLMQNGRIVEVAAAGKTAFDKGKRKAERSIDAGGRVMLPGLFDMHTHFGAWDGGLFLAAGITTIRDLGNDNATLQQYIADENRGSLLAPRIVPAGFIEGESPMSSRNGFVVKELAEAKKAIDWYAERGYPQVKIYNSFPKAILPETTAYAHSKGLRVSGHVPVYLRAQDVVEQGYDEIQHINQVLLNFLVTDKTDTRTLERFTLPAEKVAGLDFDSKPVQDFIALLAERKTVIDPTLTIHEFLCHRDGEMLKAYAAVADHLPPDVRRGFYQGQMKIADEAAAQRYAKSYDKMIEFVGRLYQAGVPIVAGTDTQPGFALQRELELYVQAGLTPAQALQVGTLNGAKYSRVEEDRGVIKPGWHADVILVDGDPTRNISDIRQVALVIKGDKAYYPSEIHEALGIKPFAKPLRVQ